MARDVDRVARSQRVLMFVAVLGLSAGVAVISTYQEEFEAGVGIDMTGSLTIAATLWFVAWRRGAWRLADRGNGALGLCLAGVIAVAAAGPNAISDVVLTARGELTQVFVTLKHTDDDDRVYAVVPLAGSLSVRGELHTQRKFHDGEIVTALVDRNGFVSPKLPEDMNTAIWVIIVLCGVGFLAGSMIGFGFPLEPSDAPAEDSTSR